VPVAAIADHYVMAGHAGDGPKAFQYSIAAAEQAIAAFAYEDAVTHYQRSLKCLAATSVPADRRCELLLCLADAQKRAGDWRQSREIFSQAAHLARQTNSAPSLARAAIGFSGLTARSPVDYEAVTLLREALANVDDPRVRVRLLGALVFTLHFDPDPTERIGLSAEALALSRGLDDASLLGEALEARINIMVGRCHGDGLADLASEAIGLAARFENPSLAFRCRTLRYAALIQIGRAREAEIEFQCCARLAAELRYPKYLWQVAAIKATRSTAKGEFAIAEQLIEEAQAVGQRHDAQVVDQYRIIQYITLLYLRGDVGTAEAALRGLVAEYPHFALTHAVFASACAALGRLSETRDALAWFDWSELCAISGFMGPFTLCYIAEAAALSRDEARARVLYWLLTPYAQQYAAMGWGGGWLGSISHYLGLLAGAVGEFDTASRHFEDAVVMNRRMDAPPFVAVTQRRYAEMLLRRNRRGDRSCARDLLQKALTTFERLHMNGHREAAEALLLGCVSVSRRSEELSKRDANSVPGSALTKSDARSSLGSPECVFRREADYWTISFEGRVLRLRNTRGLQLLSLLLRCPDANHHVLDLISAIDRQPAEMCLPHSRGPGGGAEVVATRSDAGTVIDARAREEYRRRINDLCTELEEAERFNDLGRVEALLVEKDRVSKELERAYGRGGHRRTVASASERARINIRNNISNALKRFKRSDVVLWRHLSTAVRTGTFCSYRPERPVRWTF